MDTGTLLHVNNFVLQLELVELNSPQEVLNYERCKCADNEKWCFINYSFYFYLYLTVGRLNGLDFF